MRPTLKKWRKRRPASHRSYGEKRNRDQIKRKQEEMDEKN